MSGLSRSRRRRLFFVWASVAVGGVIVATVAGVLVGFNGGGAPQPAPSGGSLTVSYREEGGTKTSSTVTLDEVRCTRFGTTSSGTSAGVTADTATTTNVLTILLTDSKADSFVVHLGAVAFGTESGPVMRGGTMTLSDQSGVVFSQKDGRLGDPVDGDATISGTVTCAGWDE